MDAFSKEDRIYFATKNRIAFAKHSPFLNKEIISRIINQKEFQESISEKQVFTQKLKRMHSAEHKLYNCFMRKVKRLSQSSNARELLSHIPSNEEIKKTESFSFFCGTTQAYFLISFSVSNLILSYITAKLLALFLSLIFSYSLIYFIQKKYFLEEPSDFEIDIAKAALKTALEGEAHDIDTHIIY